MKSKLLTAGISLVVLVGIFFALNSYIYNEKQADFKVGEVTAVKGTVLAVDLEQMMYDGPAVITLKAESGDVTNIAVPSMGLPLCAAYKNNNIGDVSLIKPGDEFEVRGTVSENGAIVPCESADHYLRPTPLVVEDFEGESDPSRMNLSMKTWEWVSVQYNDGRTITPKKPGRFTLAFGNQGALSIGTDCNSAGGTYIVGKDNKISFTEIYSTKMFCEGSQESEFFKLLENTSSYHFTSKGELILELKFDSGTVRMR